MKPCTGTVAEAQPLCDLRLLVPLVGPRFALLAHAPSRQGVSLCVLETRLRKRETVGPETSEKTGNVPSPQAAEPAPPGRTSNLL